MTLTEKLALAVYDGDMMELDCLLKQCLPCLSGEREAYLLLRDGLYRGFERAGEAYNRDEMLVPELLLAKRVFDTGAARLQPYLSQMNPEFGSACLGTVQGDTHSIGKDLVSLMLRARGIPTVDLGIDVPATEFLRAVREDGCKLICCSVLMTESRREIRKIADLLRQMGLRNQVAILIGGSAVCQKDCALLDADAYSASADDAAEKGMQLLTKMALDRKVDLS